MKKKAESAAGEIIIDGKRFQRLRVARQISRVELTKTLLGIKTVYRFNLEVP
jgi:hypothetical protein